jgi:indolepyruvate decarboxylase
MIVANSDRVRIKHHIYNHISLKDFMAGLKANLKRRKTVKISNFCCPANALGEEYTPHPKQKIAVKRFYRRMNSFINGSSVVIGESGDSIFNVVNVSLPKGASCIGQAFYLSIGYATPATLGAGLAAPDSRVITFVGDGAFQMTAQEVSTIIREKLNPVIFVMNNDGYTVERVMVDGAFNDVQRWKYSELPAVFRGGWGSVVKTEADLEAALLKAEQRKTELALIDVRLDRMDCSDAARMYGAQYKAANAKIR